MELTPQRAWSIFCRSGSIADYLQYRAALQKTSDTKGEKRCSM